jgi:hypothetical protein
VPPLFAERFIMTAAFVLDSTTCLMYLYTKLQGKCKLSFAMFYSMNFCEAKRYQLDKRISRRELSALNLRRDLPTHQKTDRLWRTSSLAPDNTYKMNFVQGFEGFYK